MTQIRHSSINQTFGSQEDLEPTMHGADLPDIASAGKLPQVQYQAISALPPGHVPYYRAVFLIANAALGAGLLNFPQAYMKAGGAGTALALQFALLAFICGSFLILARCANHCQARTYQDVILFMLGKRSRDVGQCIIALYFFGSAITYIIIIGEQLSSVVEFANHGQKTWYSDKRFCFSVFALCFLLPLCIPRRLKALSYTSFFGGIGAFFIASVIIYRYFHGGYSEAKSNEPLPSDWKSAFAALPVICFGFQCHVSSVAVYAELKNRNIKTFFSCALVAMAVCAVTYSVSGIFGLETFGAGVKADIMENYRDDDILVNIARIAIVFILLSSFSIVTFCARTVIDGIVLSVRKVRPEEAESWERPRRIIETFLWFVGALLLAAVIPDIGSAINMISGLAAMFIFVFPGLCLLQTTDLKKPLLTRGDVLTIILASLYLVLGAFIFGLVTTLAITNDIRPRQLQ